jgi:hypothetical protein
MRFQLAAIEKAIADAGVIGCSRRMILGTGGQGVRFLKSEPGPPMTLGNAAAAKVRLIVWCKSCQHQVEPDPAGMAERYGAGATVPDWRERLVCSGCGNRDIDMVADGTNRR